MNRRRWMLALGLGATVIAAWFAPPMEADGGLGLGDRSIQAGVAMPQRSSDPVGEAGVRNGRNDSVVLTVRSRMEDEQADPLSELFAAPSWASAEPKPAVVARTAEASAVDPPSPAAPPLPFVFIGQMIDGGKQTYFLRYAEQGIVAKVGDTLLEQYRIEAVEGSKLILRYLPMNQLQSLELGSSL